MAPHRQIIFFFLTFCILTTSLSLEPSRSRRQKRGIAKMMMHIMWDPVRLIRYWYAYDVTKEIAKSWRKIIPTILLLPITQHMPQSYGLAKYVHPTHGIRDYNKNKLKLKYPTIPVHSYQGSAANVKPVLKAPTSFHQAYPVRYSKVPQYAEHHYQTSSKESDSTTLYSQKDVPHVIVGHTSYEDDKEDSNPYSVAHYFVADDTSREEVHASDNVIFHGHKGSIDEGITSSPSQSVSISRYRKRPHVLYKATDKLNPLHYFPDVETHGATIRDENGEMASPILHPGQEFHIVLHPIPLNDYNPNSLKPPTDGKAIKFVPVQSQSNEPSDKNSGMSPILFKAISLESDHSHEDRAVDSSGITSHLNVSENSREEQNNATGEDTKPRVTWVQQKSMNVSRRTDQKDRDMPADGTVKQIVSVHFSTPQQFEFSKDDSNSFTIKRHHINIDRLREDLKHGTPVLIPFNRNTSPSDVPCTANHKNPIHFPHEHLNYDHRNHRTEEHISQSEAEKVPVISDSGVINTSMESSVEDNSSQRLLLFLKKRKHSYHHENA